MDRIAMAAGESLTWFVNVIEPRANQLLGAVLQSLSLHAYSHPFRYLLCILERDSMPSENLASWAEQLGLRAAVAPSSFKNPFLNKWICLNTFDELRIAGKIVLLDWDIVYTGASIVPASAPNQVRCRRNPANMYSPLLSRLNGRLPPTPFIEGGRLLSSVNGGVIVGSSTTLAKCSARTVDWERSFDGLDEAIPAWQREQIAISIAAGEIGLAELEDCWNVTPLSKVDDARICLWHYNDSVESTRRMKEQLLSTATVRSALSDLKETWPRTTSVFGELYEKTIQRWPFNALAH